MRPSSLDRRERIVAAVDRPDGALRGIARVFWVSTSFIVRRLPRRRATGTLDPKPPAGGPLPALSPDEHRRLADLIRGQPDATRAELKPKGGLTGSLKTLGMALRHRRRTRPKKSLYADQRDRPDVQKKRRSFRRKGRAIEAKRRVLGDETGVTTARTPASAGAPRGERAVDSAPASWETITVIAALGRDGVRAPLALPGATDAVAFQTSGEPVLVPERHAGDVVILDNIKPPLGTEVAQAIARAGARVLPLPPSSPDDTPIEEMFSKVKQGLRRAKARAKTELDEVLGEVLQQVTPDDIRGWFQHAGLCATHG